MDKSNWIELKLNHAIQKIKRILFVIDDGKAFETEEFCLSQARKRDQHQVFLSLQLPRWPHDMQLRQGSHHPPIHPGNQKMRSVLITMKVILTILFIPITNVIIFCLSYRA